MNERAKTPVLRVQDSDLTTEAKKPLNFSKKIKYAGMIAVGVAAVTVVAVLSKDVYPQPLKRIKRFLRDFPSSVPADNHPYE